MIVIVTATSCECSIGIQGAQGMPFHRLMAYEQPLISNLWWQPGSKGGFGGGGNVRGQTVSGAKSADMGVMRRFNLLCFVSYWDYN